MIFTEKDKKSINNLDKLISDLNSVYLKKDGYYVIWSVVPSKNTFAFKISFGKVNRCATSFFVFETIEEVELFILNINLKNLYISISSML